MSRWINLWWNYPFSKAVRYLEKDNIEVTGVALRIGPLAFCICWGQQHAKQPDKPKFYGGFPPATETE
jgi:hypothetical protein